MNRLLELVFMLVVIVFLATFASSFRNKEAFDAPASDIDQVSGDLAASGLADLDSSPTSHIRSFIKLIPNLDDLLSAGYLRPDYTSGLVGAESISARTCKDERGSLVSGMDSNKKGCTLIMDLQPYKFRSTTLKLKLNVGGTKENILALTTDKAFIDMLLMRPVFVSVEGSQPYCLDLVRNTPFLYTTSYFPTVTTYNQFPTSYMEIPIKTVPTTNTNFFPAQTRNLTDVVAQKQAHVCAVTGIAPNDLAFVEANATIYYLQREDKFGNSLEVANSAGVAYFADNPYLNSIQNKISRPPSTITTTDVSNPCLSVCFTVFVAQPGDLTQPPWWVNDYQGLLKVASDGWATCDAAGRGIALVQLVPSAVRAATTANCPYAESSPPSGKLYCLQFTNVEEDNISGQVTSTCGGVNNSEIWLPTGVSVDIAYIISPTMKLIVATYFDPSTNERNFTYTHLYNTGSSINAIYSSLINVPNLCVDNLCKRTNLDPNTFKVSNIQVSYGMVDLYEWFYSA